MLIYQFQVELQGFHLRQNIKTLSEKAVATGDKN